jgi:ABC-type sugar transport system ATPase subunit
MDEPTSSLNEVETKRLFEFINDLKEKGVAIIYISHKLNEVFEIADRVQVMRDGKRVGLLDLKETNTAELVELMVGRAIVEMYPKEEAEIGEEMMRVENLTCQFARNISFHVRKGEILGLYGLVGSGRVEAIEGLIGLRAITSGKVFIEGKEAKIDSPIDAKEQGIAYIPSDRKQEGLVLIHSVKDNMTITQIDGLGKGIRIDTRKEKEYCDIWIEKLGIKTPSRMTIINSLSGGNQQKVVISKWLLISPKVLIMNDPTRGIDVGAKVEIYTVMEELCKEGFSIIMVSAELPEVMGITDRMLVFTDGEIVGEFERGEYDQSKILHLAVK